MAGTFISYENALDFAKRMFPNYTPEKLSKVAEQLVNGYPEDDDTQDE